MDMMGMNVGMTAKTDKNGQPTGVGMDFMGMNMNVNVDPNQNNQMGFACA